MKRWFFPILAFLHVLLGMIIGCLVADIAYSEVANTYKIADLIWTSSIVIVLLLFEAFAARIWTKDN